MFIYCICSYALKSKLKAGVEIVTKDNTDEEGNWIDEENNSGSSSFYISLCLVLKIENDFNDKLLFILFAN